MSVSEELLSQIKQFLDGKTDPEAFSYDFPEDLAERFKELEKENRRLAELLNEDMPEICANFEPEASLRTHPDYLDEPTFHSKVSAVYEQALKVR